ncbi:MAG: hypothetical protein CYPHOPRED_004469, partial [Cyphobasidiales sp. Tagirdzhanova-0007]
MVQNVKTNDDGIRQVMIQNGKHFTLSIPLSWVRPQSQMVGKDDGEQRDRPGSIESAIFVEKLARAPSSF